MLLVLLGTLVFAMYVVKRCAIAPFVTLAVQATANKKKTAEERIFMHRLFMSRIMKIFF